MDNFSIYNTVREQKTMSTEKMLFAGWLVLAVARTCLSQVQWTGTKESDSGKIPQEVITRASRATVLVRTPGGIGAGFFVTTNGYLLTNYHVIEGASKAIVETRAGKKFRVQYVCGYSPKLDLAMLKVNGQAFDCLPFSDPTQVNLDDSVFIIGHPHGHTWTLTKGYIAGKRRENDRPVIQFSADISPGNSGGPVLLYDGTVCGIATYMEKRSIRFSDGNYILDPSAVLKFGIAVDAFQNATKHPEKLRRHTLAQVAEFNAKIQTLRLLAGILDITHDRLTALREGLTRLKFDTNYAYDRTYRTLDGNYRVTDSQTIVYNADDFVEAAAGLRAAGLFLRDYIADKTGEKAIDSAVDDWRTSVNAADSSIRFIVAADGSRAGTASARVRGAKKSFNSSIAAMDSALSSTEKALKQYDKYITDHIASPSRIAELRRMYKSGKLKL